MPLNLPARCSLLLCLAIAQFCNASAYFRQLRRQGKAAVVGMAAGPTLGRRPIPPSPPIAAASAELELLYQAHTAQASRIAALEGEVFLLKRRVRELAEHRAPSSLADDQESRDHRQQ